MGVLSGKVAVVTGGASGIGRATVRRLAEAGSTVLVVDRDVGAGQDVAEEVDGCFLAADVSQPEDWAAVVRVAEDEFGGVDIAHLNAGVDTGESDLTRLTDAQYRRILGANVDGVVFGIRAVVPAMQRRHGGAIVVTASMAGLLGWEGDPIYSLTKHAVVGLVRSLPAQLTPAGITINAVCPGLVDTPILPGGLRDDLVSSGFPLIEPGVVADAVYDLVVGSETGEAVVVQVGREPVAYRFRGVPAPRLEQGAEIARPPEL
jgi:NAD(P)-dependent dehydrogenase (short-subunit alcohol dehydrogenase family)